MALGREVVDFRRLRFLNNANKVRRVGHVAVVQREGHVLLVLVLIQMIDAIGIERGGPTLDAVHDVALAEQQLCKIGAILPGDAGDESNFLSHGSPFVPLGAKIKKQRSD